VLVANASCKVMCFGCRALAGGLLFLLFARGASPSLVGMLVFSVPVVQVRAAPLMGYVGWTEARISVSFAVEALPGGD
jgi:hypothetical protein